MLPVQVIEDRFRAMYHVAKVIQGSWIWAIMSLTEMGSRLASLRSKRDAFDTAGADVVHTRGVLDEELVLYRANIRGYLRVAKLRYKKQAGKFKEVKDLRLKGDSREAALTVGSKVEKAWKKIDQSFVPLPGMTYGGTHDCGVRCVQYSDDYSTAETELTNTNKELRAYAAETDEANVEWYATATTMFPEGTAYGELIRSMVPTNNRVVQPVKPAIIDLAEASGAGKVFLQFHAPHATSYRLAVKRPGSAEWEVVAEGIDALTFLMTGLTDTGVYQFRVSGSNSRGEGPASAIVTVDVPVAAAA